MRSHCKDRTHRRCGRNGFKKTGECLDCKRIIPLKSRGWHRSTQCETKGAWNKGLVGPPAWNKGLTKENNESLRRVSQAVEKGWKDPAHRARMVEAISIAQKRRFENPEERKKSRERALGLIESGKIVPFGGRKHGNGRPPTESEREMLLRLGPYGFEAEHVVPTEMKPRRGGMPTHYKIDLANPETKIAVEIDGSSHRQPRREAADSRKDSFLQSKGWTVLRFQVPFDYDAASQECIGLVST